MEPTDTDYMIRLAQGDDLSLNVLMDRWGSRITAYLYRMTGNREHALDLAQETFFKLYQARDRYRPDGNFSTYLFSIASNLSKNHARWKMRHPTVSLDAKSENDDAGLPETVDPHADPGEIAQSAEKMAAVAKAFQALPPDLREAMSLFIYEDMSYAEIGTLMGCSTKAVETRIYRARQTLKERLKDLAPQF